MNSVLEHGVLQRCRFRALRFYMRHIVHQLQAFIFFVAVCLFITFFIIQMLLWMWNEQQRSLSAVSLVGEKVYLRDADIQQALSESPGTYFSHNIEAIHQKIEDIPWIEQAVVRKEWPNTIYVYFNEHKIEAIWNGQSLLSDQGKVIEADVSRVDPQLPIIYGAPHYIELLQRELRIMQDQVAKWNLKVTNIALNPQGEWKVGLSNGVQIILGVSPPHNKLQQLQAIYDDLGAKFHLVKYIDMRYDVGAAIGWSS